MACFLILLAVVSAVSCQSDGVKSLAVSNSIFGLNVYKEIGTGADTCNIFYSPMSVSTALSMTYLGARSDTKNEMTTSLQFERLLTTGSDENVVIHQNFKDLNDIIFAMNTNYTLKTANRLYGPDDNYNTQYLQNTQMYYGARLENQDFVNNSEAARLTINSWVEQQTERTIKNLLPSGSITPNTKLVLVNAIYFKGLWANPFNPEVTAPEDFNIDKTRKVKTQMMSNSFRTMYGKSGDLDSILVELPYSGKNVSMFVVLPNEIDGLAAVEKKLDMMKLNDLITKLSSKKVNIKLPKFKMEIPLEMKEILINVGINKAFVPGVADFSGILSSAQKNLFLSSVDHKAFIQVDEEGTEASAATGIGISVTSIQIHVEVNVNRPFMFFIRHNPTGSILFMGRLRAPPGEKCTVEKTTLDDDSGTLRIAATFILTLIMALVHVI